MKFLIPLAVLSYCFGIINAHDIPTKNRTDLHESPQYSGFDRHGNFFRGNKNTGFYYNYGTGETCFGKHQERKCYMAKN